MVGLNIKWGMAPFIYVCESGVPMLPPTLKLSPDDLVRRRGVVWRRYEGRRQCSNKLSGEGVRLAGWASFFQASVKIFWPSSFNMLFTFLAKISASFIEITNFDPTQIYLGAPKILKPVLDTDIPFQGLLLGKVWTMPQTLGRNVGVLGPQILMGVHKFWTQFLKLHLYATFWAIKVAYQSSDLEY